MIELRMGNIVVRSNHPQADEAFARVVATVLQDKCLEGVPEDEPLAVDFEHEQHGRITYVATIERPN